MATIIGLGNIANVPTSPEIPEILLTGQKAVPNLGCIQYKWQENTKLTLVHDHTYERYYKIL